MDDTKTAPKPAPEPKPEPPKNVAKEAEAAIAKAKTGFDPLRPLRYAVTFINGTITDTLNGIARSGRKGLKYGAILGAVVGIATGGVVIGGLALTGLSTLFVSAGVGFLGAAAVGGTKGLINGGMRAVNRERRAVLYAEDLIDRSHIQGAAPDNRHDFRKAYRAHQTRSDIISQQVLAREAENARDNKTYWQDHVSSRSSGRGMGF